MELFFLLTKIEAYLDDLAHNHWQRFVCEDGTIEVNMTVFEEAMESMEMNESELDTLEKIVKSDEAVAAIYRMFAQMELIVRELAEDAAEWSRAQRHGIPGILRYHGLSVSDFV